MICVLLRGVFVLDYSSRMTPEPHTDVCVRDYLAPLSYLSARASRDVCAGARRGFSLGQELITASFCTRANWLQPCLWCVRAEITIYVYINAVNLY